MKTFFSLGLLVALASTTFAQTFTTCNPLNSTCPSDIALGLNNTWDFSQQLDNNVWNQTAGTLNYGQNGAAFTINRRGDAPEVASTFYIFFGVVEVIMKAASGQGVISSVVLQSDDLDEVDWEWMGGNSTHVETNYFGKGNTTTFDRAIYYPVSTPQNAFHNYTIVWTSEEIKWMIDGNVVRTLPYAAANGGNNFPQTPMNVRIGIWAGGDSANPKGTIEWAGGPVDYNAGPFTMVVQSVRITDGSKGSSYSYGDNSGSFKTIKVASGNSTVANTINAPPAQSITQQINNLPSGTKYAIFGSVGAAIAIALLLFAWCCIRMRRAGRRERLVEEAKMATLHRENNTLPEPDFDAHFHQHSKQPPQASYYNEGQRY